jgi:hypothetical protein
MVVKNLLREITPPVLWRLAAYVKRAIRQPPAENS